MSQTVLAIVAHPDDEVLGCGGTLAKHAHSGDDVYAVILAEGITSRQDHRNVRDVVNELATLRDASREAAKLLGLRKVLHASLPDNRMDSVDFLDIVKCVEQFIKDLCPSIVYTHASTDLNIDHQLTARAVLTACRPLPSHPVHTLLEFETPSSTEWQAPNCNNFQPNWFVDIADYLPQKLAALVAYEQEMRPFPHPRSYEAIKHLAAWRGTCVGIAAAESFRLIRKHI